ncbi:MAG: sigma-70 family RNA polymerase sigma factor [Phycisphaerae bacterium]|nr:sigma-70 family RNA polymerase sigma factor [Phycisphaerae bacterium]
MILAAKDPRAPAGRQALETLCRTYWVPLYAYVRRCGHGPQDAEDLTQGFLTRLIEKDLVRAADRERGRFRSFLLTSLKHFVADQRDRAKAVKRGGLARRVPMDVGSAETRFRLEPVDEWTPDRFFEHQWAVTVLETVFDRLRRQYEAEGKTALFDQAKGSLTQAGTSVSYADLGARLAMTEGAVRVAVHRLRSRYRDLLREEIGHTVADPAEVEDEIRHLFQALAGPRGF